MPDLPFAWTTLTSTDNSRVKNIIKLRKAAYRRQTHTFIIEGYRELGRAINSGIRIKEIYFCPELFSKGNEQKLILRAGRTHTAIFEVSEKVYAKITFGNRKEGLIALADEPHLSLADIPEKENPLIVVIERIEKPGNLGAIIRTAYAAGADAVIAADTQADVYNPQAVRASIGTLFSMRVIAAASPVVIQWLKARNIQIVCACVQAKSAYTAIDFSKPSAIVLGSEEKGLSEIWKRAADYEAAIPMEAGADSLNVSTAAGILLFEAVRQRKS
jgi:TrmH family RNA methyltransferase